MFDIGDTIFNILTLKKGFITNVRGDRFFRRTKEGLNVVDHQYSYRATGLNVDTKKVLHKEFDLGSHWFPGPLFRSSKNLLIEKYGGEHKK
jgi:hypothetical protein